MIEPMKFVHSLLSAPIFYQLAMLAVGSPHTRRIHVTQYIRPKTGDRILDVGCGPADIIESLPDVTYFGIDINPAYIEAAQKKYPNRGSFACKDVTEITISEFEPFDIILATGLLHHLSDFEVSALLRACSKLLKAEGRMITYDGCRTENQHPFDTWMLNNDRGKFVRTRAAYEQLASSVFDGVKMSVRSDLLRIPYTLAIMELSHTSSVSLSEIQQAEPLAR